MDNKVENLPQQQAHRRVVYRVILYSVLSVFILVFLYFYLNRTNILAPIIICKKGITTNEGYQKFKGFSQCTDTKTGSYVFSTAYISSGWKPEYASYSLIISDVEWESIYFNNFGIKIKKPKDILCYPRKDYDCMTNKWN